MDTTANTALKTPNFKLFHVGGTRSERVRWMLRELQIEHDLISEPATSRLTELKAAHPLNKVPAITVPEGSLFESLAICNWLADSHPDRKLGWRAGTWERALHDQWTAFTLAELEANLWHTARNKFLYPEHLKVPQVYDQNARESRRALAVFEEHLRDREWLVGSRFSVTDIFSGLAICWASWDGLTAEFDAVNRYITRLQALPNCPYRKA
ncbi:MAG TPA: glutathione S-transferase family protein [Xanthobacteraceae bacterium]|nr:glutathione S-transferase family protein [Xanthobacteraceae bacterium]